MGYAHLPTALTPTPPPGALSKMGASPILPSSGFPRGGQAGSPGWTLQKHIGQLPLESPMVFSTSCHCFHARRWESDPSEALKGAQEKNSEMP